MGDGSSGWSILTCVRSRYRRPTDTPLRTSPANRFRSRCLAGLRYPSMTSSLESSNALHPAAAVGPGGAADDDQLIAICLHSRSEHTTRAYRADVERFRSRASKPLQSVTLADLQGFADSLGGAPASRYRTLSAVKSLLGFGHRIGYLPFDVGRVLRLPAVRNPLA